MAPPERRSIQTVYIECLLEARKRWAARRPPSFRKAQFEHTVLVTDRGYEIMTLP